MYIRIVVISNQDEVTNVAVLKVTQSHGDFELCRGAVYFEMLRLCVDRSGHVISSSSIFRNIAYFPLGLGSLGLSRL
jgi:hypothetical protein